MPDSLVNPLQVILDKAAKLPDTGQVAKVAKRINTDNRILVIVLDLSGSMADPIETGKSKISVLREAVSQVNSNIAIGFNSSAFAVELDQIPDPMGSTRLDLALRLAASFHPRYTLVISDGLPDSEPDSLAAALQLPGTINTLYVGRDDNKKAIAFMQSLAAIGCGYSQNCDIYRSEGSLRLRSAIVNLLPAG
jgi:hypothetical protein